jgi:hypothetical protein
MNGRGHTCLLGGITVAFVFLTRFDTFGTMKANMFRFRTLVSYVFTLISSISLWTNTIFKGR